MLRQRPIQHKRKNSQLDLFYPSNYGLKLSEEKRNNVNKSKTKKTNNNNLEQKDKLNKHVLKLKMDSQNNSEGKNVLKLVSNSQKRVHQKQTVVQNINDHFQDQNLDYCNGVYYVKNCNSQQIDENSDPFFQFGKKGRNQSLQKQYIDSPFSCLNMQQITQVPDTMSNQRRYQNNNFHQFTTPCQNSLINSAQKLIDQQPQSEQSQEVLQPRKNNSKIFLKTNQDSKSLKVRKQKVYKRNVVGGQQLNLQKNKLDFSELNQTKRQRGVFINRRNDKKQNSKQQLKKVQKQKSKASLLSSKKSKNLSQGNLMNKKSLSLRNEDKGRSKISQKKPKSFQKLKDNSLNGKILLNSKILSSSSNKGTKSTRISQFINDHSKQNSLILGQKIMMIEESQNKLQNQYKVLWECVGELWQNTRITRYISQKNKSDIAIIKDTQKMDDQKLIRLKSDIITSISSARY